MKTVIYFGLFLLLLLGRNSLAQNINNEFILNQQSDTNFNVPYAQPAKLDFLIPIKVDHSYIYKPNRGQSTGKIYAGIISDSIKHVLSMTRMDYLVQSYELDGRVTLYNYAPTVYNSTQIVKYSLDTVNKLLVNLYVYFKWGSGFNYLTDSFTITSIPYTILWNHNLFATAQGIDFFSKLTGVYYYSQGVNSDGMNNITESYYEYHALGNDTQLYRFSINLKTMDPAFGVSIQKDQDGSFLSARVDELSGLLTFSFPSANQPREFKIYDLMGREVYRTSVTQGVTSLFISKNILPSGCYIAMLGNSRAKFIISK